MHQQNSTTKSSALTRELRRRQTARALIPVKIEYERRQRDKIARAVAHVSIQRSLILDGYTIGEAQLGSPGKTWLHRRTIIPAQEGTTW